MVLNHDNTAIVAKGFDFTKQFLLSSFADSKMRFELIQTYVGEFQQQIFCCVCIVNPSRVKCNHLRNEETSRIDYLYGIFPFHLLRPAINMAIKCKPNMLFLTSEIGTKNITIRKKF